MIADSIERAARYQELREGKQEKISPPPEGNGDIALLSPEG